MRGKHLTSYPKASGAVGNPISLVLDGNQNCPPCSRSYRSQWDLRKRWLLLAELNLNVSPRKSPRTQWELHRKVLGHGEGSQWSLWLLFVLLQSRRLGRESVQCKAQWVLGARDWEGPRGRWNPVCGYCREHLSRATHKACNRDEQCRTSKATNCCVP